MLVDGCLRKCNHAQQLMNHDAPGVQLLRWRGAEQCVVYAAGMLDTWIHRAMSMLAGTGLLPMLGSESRQNSMSGAEANALTSLPPRTSSGSLSSQMPAWNAPQQQYPQMYSNGHNE